MFTLMNSPLRSNTAYIEDLVQDFVHIIYFFITLIYIIIHIIDMLPCKILSM